MRKQDDTIAKHLYLPHVMTRTTSLSRPRLSVSIVAYMSQPGELTTLLHCLSNSSAKPIVTVVDNSPSRDLQALVEQSGAAYVFSGCNLGFGAGHNVAMQQALQASTYHLVCNPDISFSPDVLAELLRYMERNPDVGLVMPRILYPNGSEQRLCKLLPTPIDLLLRRFLGRIGGKLLRSSRERYELRHHDLASTCDVPSLSGCFMFLRCDVLRQVGLFDPRYFMYLEDVDLCRRIGAVARTVFYPFVSITHSYAKGSYKEKKLLRYHIISAIRYFNKWGWLLDSGRRALNVRVAQRPFRPSIAPTPRTAQTSEGTR